MKESVFEKRVKECLTKCDAMRLKVHGHMMQDSGWPDLYVCHIKWQGWIELKVEDENLRENQKICIKGIRRRGGNALVVRCKQGLISCDGAEAIIAFEDISPLNIINMIVAWTRQINPKFVQQDFKGG